MFLFNEEIAAVSYKPKETKLVTLISTAHGNEDINEANGKPSMIMDYNAFSRGVWIRWTRCVTACLPAGMKKLASIDFLLELHKQLTVAHQRSRLLNPRIRGELRSIIEYSNTQKYQVALIPEKHVLFVPTN
uniref:Uncharacterized protein n=1 Tax=Cacopsylla melanoneura TaxID=428564 RepID=A0A8D8VRE4_9HEMI